MLFAKNKQTKKQTKTVRLSSSDKDVLWSSQRRQKVTLGFPFWKSERIAQCRQLLRALLPPEGPPNDFWVITVPVCYLMGGGSPAPLPLINNNLMQERRKNDVD